MALLALSAWIGFAGRSAAPAATQHPIVMNSFEPHLEILPRNQRELWPLLSPVADMGFVLYGGTAIALRLGHRTSVDFDFFTADTVDRQRLRQELPFLQHSHVRQDGHETFVLETANEVKLSFFGGLNLGHIYEPEQTADGVAAVASLPDLMATKLKVIFQRSEWKDYYDIAAMIGSGVRVDEGLAAAEQMYRPQFAPQIALRAMVYFNDGDLKRLDAKDRKTLIDAATAVKRLPEVSLRPGLRSSDESLLKPINLAQPSIDISQQPPAKGARHDTPGS